MILKALLLPEILSRLVAFVRGSEVAQCTVYPILPGTKVTGSLGPECLKSDDRAAVANGNLEHGHLARFRV